MTRYSGRSAPGRDAVQTLRRELDALAAQTRDRAAYGTAPRRGRHPGRPRAAPVRYRVDETRGCVRTIITPPCASSSTERESASDWVPSRTSVQPVRSWPTARPIRCRNRHGRWHNQPAFRIRPRRGHARLGRRLGRGDGFHDARDSRWTGLFPSPECRMTCLANALRVFIAELSVPRPHLVRTRIAISVRWCRESRGATKSVRLPMARLRSLWPRSP